MGVKPFLVASSIQAIMAQRLIRILCDKCKAPDEDPDHKFLKLTDITDEDRAKNTIFKPVGCDACGGSGYKGRRAINELMLLNSQIRELAFNGAPIAEIRKAAITGGMRPLLGDGKIKILKGMTTPEEIARVAQAD